MTTVKRVQSSKEYQVHHAEWIVVDPDTVIRKGYVEIADHRVVNVSDIRPEGNINDHGKGIILPLLVNAHVHLELSALHRQLPFDKGFEQWVAALLEKREKSGLQRLKQAAAQALLQLDQSATGYIGEISTLNLTADLMTQSLTGGVFFHEVIGEAVPELSLKNGLAEPDTETRQAANLFSLSAAGHAPHSCSPDLLKDIKAKTRQESLVFSIHLAESGAESEFIREKRGSWANFLTSRGIKWGNWEIRAKTPVTHAADIGILDSQTLAVHLLNTDENDLKVLKKTGARACVCPRSNLNLHDRFPDVEAMLSAGLQPAIGTDSLASCDSLNLLDEMAFVSRKFPRIPAKDIFSMASLWGAQALGLEQETGTLHPGKKGDFIYMETPARSEDRVFQEVIHHG